MKIVLAQMNMHVGAIQKNTDKIIALIKKTEVEKSADLLVFPELALSGYPPEDLLLRPDFYKQCDDALKKIQAEIKEIAVIIGYPEKIEGKHYNAAAVIQHQKIIAHYQKQILPNYTVFDEKRYFTEGNSPCIFEFQGFKIGLLICEDIWHSAPIKQAKDHAAEFIVTINASPYHHEQAEKRLLTLQQRTHETALPILYCNCVGGQDEIVFDGGSMAMNSSGELVAQAPFYKENMLIISIEKNATIIPSNHNIPEKLSDDAKTYETIKLGVKDYLAKNAFKGALIGLSGGIDSALTLAIAADAIGAENMTAVIMPSEFTAEMSIEDAIAEAEALGVDYKIIPIKAFYHQFLETLNPYFENKNHDATEENLQARIRGVILMALSNKTGKIVLTTGNKSEMAVGYCTLYGDMAGGFAVIKDVFKTAVYRLARYRNSISKVIPERVITRAPTAELKHDQTDQDKLPSYDILDSILENYIEKNKSAEDIVALGFDKAVVDEIIRLVHLNEYKRRQAPIGPRLSERAFGKDWRYPISR
ncbi:MAG: NAD+ synthase [Coxiellaceae bacterium]|nr:NAD+ synthase [Coxiellaceae bacterium]